MSKLRATAQLHAGPCSRLRERHHAEQKPCGIDRWNAASAERCPLERCRQSKDRTAR